MKIVHLSPSLLTLRLRPVRLWIFGGMFVAAGLFTVAIFAQVTTLSCTRIEPANCKLVTSGVLGSKSKEIPLNMLQGAEVEEDRDNHGSSTYRVVILKSSGKVPFTPYFSSGKSDKQAKASDINNFIRNSGRTSLTQKQDDRSWTYLLGGISILVAIIMFGVPYMESVFDKNLDTLTIKRQGLFGTDVIQHHLSEIQDVLVEESTDSDDRSTYRVTIVLVGGDRLPLTSDYSLGRTDKLEIASSIQDFLNLN